MIKNKDLVVGIPMSLTIKPSISLAQMFEVSKNKDKKVKLDKNNTKVEDNEKQNKDKEEE